jgi:hypothetical protein
MKLLNVLLLCSLLSVVLFSESHANSAESRFIESPIEIQAAQQITSKNKNQTYQDPTPAVLFAIPIFKVFVDANGLIQNIEILRIPSNPEAQFTVQLGLEAIQRAEPFKILNSDQQPVVFNQTFLFRDDLKFKLRALDIE